MYKYNDKMIPKAKDYRKEVNEKTLALLKIGKLEDAGITKEIIYNAFTGKGGLHNFSASDFVNYNEYAKEKRNYEEGAFFTPHALAGKLMKCLKPCNKDIIVDPTCGASIFCNFVPCESNFHGNDIDENYILISKYLYPEATFSNVDVRIYNPEIKADFVVGNPPFSLRLGEDKSETVFFEKATDILRVGGIVAAIVPYSFLNDNLFCLKEIKKVTKELSFLGQIKNSDTAFKDTGVTLYETKIVFFQKVSEDEGIEIQKYPYDANIIFEEDTEIEVFYNEKIKPAKEIAEKMKWKVISQERNKNSNFIYQARKMLYQIKIHPKTSMKYSKALHYYEKFFNQVKSNEIDVEEWEKVKITEKKVISYLKRIIRNQNKKEPKDIIRAVKTKYTVKIKGYSPKTKKQVNESYGDNHEISINHLVLNKDYSMGGIMHDKGLQKMLKKKMADFDIASVPIVDRVINKETYDFIRMITFYDPIKEEIIELNEVQLNDTVRMLHSPYGALQWEQGSGKTLGALAMSLYRMKRQNARYTVVTGTAIAIRNTWSITLDNYGQSYILIDKPSDVDKIKKGDFVLITLNQLEKCKHQIKKFIKKNSEKLSLIVDESDNICSLESGRTNVALSLFRRVKYKLLTSGTLNRNSIVESFTQFEMLYNNSINMLSECENLFEYNEKDKEIKEEANPHYKQTYPAYKKGLNLFKKSHIPGKTTVLGIKKHNQDIYNAEAFKALVNKTVITRTLEEIKGTKPYTIEQNLVSFSKEEKDLYEKIVTDFRSMSYLFTSSGNAKLDRYLEIMRQLNTMLKACVVPEEFLEYKSDRLSSKLTYILDEIEKTEDYVAVGLTHLISVKHYATEIRKRYPNRVVYEITGNKVSLKKRLQLIKEMRNTPGSILVCTQQSLSSSLDIEFVDNIFIPELDWNFSKMSQWFMRFCRYNSKEIKNIRFVTYEYSIESNLLSLIIAKERITAFIKNKEDKNDELYEKFGVTFNLLDMLLEKVKDSDGKVKIEWGKQNIA